MVAHPEAVAHPEEAVQVAQLLPGPNMASAAAADDDAVATAGAQDPLMHRAAASADETIQIAQLASQPTSPAGWLPEYWGSAESPIAPVGGANPLHRHATAMPHLDGIGDDSSDDGDELLSAYNTPPSRSNAHVPTLEAAGDETDEDMPELVSASESSDDDQMPRLVQAADNDDVASLVSASDSEHEGMPDLVPAGHGPIMNAPDAWALGDQGLNQLLALVQQLEVHAPTQLRASCLSLRSAPPSCHRATAPSCRLNRRVSRHSLSTPPHRHAATYLPSRRCRTPILAPSPRTSARE